MTTISDIVNLLNNPTTTDNVDISDIRHLLEMYPFCEPLHWIYLRIIYTNNDITFDSELQNHIIYISDRSSLYHYITYTSPCNNANSLTDEQLLSSTSISYFDVTQNKESEQTLQQLAARLKAARMAQNAKITQTKPKSTTTNSQPPQTSNSTHSSANNHLSEENARKMIKMKKYAEALEILQEINLTNSKKNAYFALQLRYLETIINNQNKTK